MIPLGERPDAFRAFFADAQRTEVLDVCIEHLCGYHAGLAKFLTEIAGEPPLGTPQRVTESHELEMVQSAIDVDEGAWRACMAEMKAIITAPYNGGAGIGFDPMNEIGLAPAKHLNVIPGNGVECQSVA